MSIIFPAPLCQGQTIGIFSPSSSIVPERFEAGLLILRERGYKLVIHPQTYEGSTSGNQQAGTAEQKAAAFMELWADKNIHAIIASCGGNSAVHMLPLLNWDKIKATPKTLMGFSDTTALISALYQKTKISGYFGPTVQTLGRIRDLNLIFQVLESNQSDIIPLLPAKVIKHGLVEAPVFAATLSVLLSLAGTEFFPSLEGHILILEDIGEELSHLDRMLWQLRQVIDFKKLAGIAFGEFVDIKDTGRPLGLSFDDIMRYHTADIDGPVIINAPIGHGNSLFPIPLGWEVTLDTQNTPHLILL